MCVVFRSWARHLKHPRWSAVLAFARRSYLDRLAEGRRRYLHLHTQTKFLVHMEQLAWHDKLCEDVARQTEQGNINGMCQVVRMLAGIYKVKPSPMRVLKPNVIPCSQ